MDVGEISRALSARVEDVVQYLLPAGKKKNNEWCVGSADGEPGASLRVHLTGRKAGIFADFAGSDRGDLIDLWMSVRSLSIADAVKEAKEFLGIQIPEFHGSRKKTFNKPVKDPNLKGIKNGSSVRLYLRDERKLTDETLAAFKIAEYKDNKGPAIVLPFLRGEELVNIKYLRVDRDVKGKKISWFPTSECELCLFGWHLIPASARIVIITEGEIDAMSWYQYGFVFVLSIPNGATSLTWIENDYEYLERFEKIYLSFDMDDSGKQGIQKVVERLGRHRCFIINLPYKDANECLQNGVTAEIMQQCLDNAETCDPSELRSAASYHQDIINEFYPTSKQQIGISLPWRKFYNKFRVRRGELTVWTGFSSHGKTTMLGQANLALMYEGERCCIASLETKAPKLLSKLTRQATAQRLPSKELIGQTCLFYDDRLWVFDKVSRVNPKYILEVFLYCYQRYNVTQFVLDNLVRTNIPEDDYKGQGDFVNAFAEFCTSKNVHGHLVAHARKRQDDSKTASRLDVRGAGAITDLAFNCLSVWRHMDKERDLEKIEQQGGVAGHELLEKCDAVLTCDKQREGDGWIGSVPLWFDKESMQFVDEPNGIPFRYVTADRQYKSTIEQPEDEYL